jgi:hypothetical protein
MVFKFYFATALAIFSFNVSAQEAHPFYDTTGKHTGVFLCVPELASGIRFDMARRRWTHGQFRTNGNSIVVKVEVSGRGEVDLFGELVHVTEYAVSVSKLGEQNSEICIDNGSSKGIDVHISNNGLIRCSTGLLDFKVNLGTMRYLEVYANGYIDGRDEEGNTPAITVGKCSRID